MTAPFTFAGVQDVRTLLDLNANASSHYSDDLILSNLRSAAWFLERATGRIFRDESSLTLTFTTNGEAAVYLPGLRTAASVALNGAALTADSSYWLIPDLQQSGVATSIQFRPFGTGGSGGPWYLGIPDWFDRNLDSPYWTRGGNRSSLPNDLAIAGAWGYVDAALPEPVRIANKVAAAFMTLRADVLLSGTRVTPDGGVFDLSQWPLEVQQFVAEWRLGRQAVGI